MQTIYELKEKALTETPLVLFECQLGDGRTERWATHKVRFDGQTFEARLMGHTLFEIQSASDQGVDSIPKIAVVLANADGHFSEIERSCGFKGAKITVRFLFFDLASGAAASDSAVLFQGLVNPPEEITESAIRLSAINRMSMQRVLLPEVRIQRRCPWEFPTTAEERSEAVDGGTRTKHSRFYRCGYSPDEEGGAGNLNGAAPFTSCGRTRADCEARGMFQADSAGRGTKRFGGVEFVPPTIAVRSYGEKGAHASSATENEARYNDFVPLVYGTAWTSPPVVFGRNDGNLTRMEVLLGMGPIDGVLKVLVNDIEIPMGQSGINMTGTGWYNLLSPGWRNGEFNPDFTSNGAPAGDPYGSMAVMSVVVPNRINDGRALPKVRVLLRGLKLSCYHADGTYDTERFTNNPAWILYDILWRSGWHPDELDTPSFASAAAFCEESIESCDVYGNPTNISRFQCNYAVTSRRSAGDLIRGIRNASRLFLTYAQNGKVRLAVENALAIQQSTKPDQSNATEELGGGWPAYEFGDGSSAFSGIRRRDNGEASLRVWSRSTADTPNRFSVEFQDEFNEYQQDSFSLSDSDDIGRTGQEISGSPNALGIPNFDQAARALALCLRKSVEGNCYIEFETSVRAVGLKAGDLITLTYLKEGFNRQPFRILKIAPAVNYRTVALTAQIHKDEWYLETNGQAAGQAGRQPNYGLGLPRPLIGTVANEWGGIDFAVIEQANETGDGTTQLDLSVEFVPPATVSATNSGIPLISLTADSLSEGGTLPGNRIYYYAISSAGADGSESALSFVVSAHTGETTNTNQVKLKGIGLPGSCSGFHVYRGSNPAQLYRIASSQPPASELTDSGLAAQLAGPPDPYYDHANFYWRLELQPEYAADLHTPDSVGNSTLNMRENAYRSRIVRITRGKGAGQERAIFSNSQTAVRIGSGWQVEPDETSQFSIAEGNWRLGVAARTSPAVFEVPNRPGAVVQVSGRAANINEDETPAELSPVTRYQLGTGISEGLPPAPTFGVNVPGNGTLELSGVGFSNLENTSGITAGTFTVHYWNELAGGSAFQIQQTVDGAADTIQLNLAGSAAAGDLIQAGKEIMKVLEISNQGATYRVSRAAQASSAVTHGAGEAIYHLEQRVAVVPFVRGFFGSPWSADWYHSLALPNARVVSVELFVSSRQGDSAVSCVNFSQWPDKGLRTLSGGQFSLQVEGFLAIQDGATPELFIEATRSVRDAYASVREPADAEIRLELRQGTEPYCELKIPATKTISDPLDGAGLPLLRSGAMLNLDVKAVGQTNPGADLTVTIRL